MFVVNISTRGLLFLDRLMKKVNSKLSSRLSKTKVVYRLIFYDKQYVVVRLPGNNYKYMEFYRNASCVLNLISTFFWQKTDIQLLKTQFYKKNRWKTLNVKSTVRLLIFVFLFNWCLIHCYIFQLFGFIIYLLTLSVSHNGYSTNTSYALN